jgi:hypothetical protein
MEVADSTTRAGADKNSARRGAAVGGVFGSSDTRDTDDFICKVRTLCINSPLVPGGEWFAGSV